MPSGALQFTTNLQPTGVLAAWRAGIPERMNWINLKRRTVFYEPSVLRSRLVDSGNPFNRFAKSAAAELEDGALLDGILVHLACRRLPDGRSHVDVAFKATPPMFYVRRRVLHPILAEFRRRDPNIELPPV